MINTLHIKNIGIIDDITINLNEGFNVLTGETGAGKTLIIGSLQILAGGRFSKDMIRNGENISYVEMDAYIPNMGYENDTVIVSREINIKGKNTCKINGRLVTVSELKNFMNNIIDIHGQNDNQSILDISTHIDLLDEYAYTEIKDVKDKYSKLFEEYSNIKLEIAQNYGDDKEKQRKLDLLNYQVNEIENANLKVGEEKELEERRTVIMSSEKITLNLSDAENKLNDIAIDSINIAIKDLEKIEKYNEEYSKILNRLKDSYYEVQEAARDISYLNSDMYFDANEQNEIEERLKLIKSLKRKYGNDIEEILEYKDKVDKEIYDIENLEGYINTLKKKMKHLENEMYELSQKMNVIRNEYAQKLSLKINKEFEELEMKNAKFSVKIDYSNEKKFNKNGLDKIEFQIITNIGEEPKSLIKIASGGEMSRFMLAIKSVLADVDKIPVIIFDEIDTGISGIAANATGEKIKTISKNHQVICVTHLASIAAKGDYNYYVCKEIEDNKTKTKVKLLSEKEVLEEIARISSGSVTNISIKHAKELRKRKLKEIA